MTNHYYSQQPEAESNRKSWTFTLRGNSFHFQSDRGVFSKNEVDFGSRLLIETFTKPEQKGDMLDVGCGYGPIGISLAKEFKDLTVDMIDVNERAVELAKVNAEANGVKNVRIIASNLFENVDPSKKYAAVLTNPPIRAGKKVVHEIFEKSFESLLPGGELWIVIQKKQGAPSAIAKLGEMFKEVVTVKKDKGYFIIRAEKD
ncbi:MULTISPECIES: class I SAM-dependent methyltransferase [Metabacillus]|uniref:Class I SAM-dependent methyltransferase n=1 Tax=Metabacillus hrfriensis TaxID=3048891 RepID=A0ACD4RBY4_9BACI|nr:MULTISPECIES: class I SAM-dependent methyltransferase [Metabacillus]UAL52432.1 class I SAM-dependent methyltransferase [Metabacillus dongyingensis]UOK58148.1 class I SAM-dependent methyltransferase [Bacillus sp. OVS6]USK28743.1 class I SAM-dependent methyltransferase [Bacillus sp. CMF21]WHZ57961.1 class I SAM-dependent methyltransferase [Metabacillus sp. CT-WN-B3]